MSLFASRDIYFLPHGTDFFISWDEFRRLMKLNLIPLAHPTLFFISFRQFLHHFSNRLYLFTVKQYRSLTNL